MRTGTTLELGFVPHHPQHRPMIRESHEKLRPVLERRDHGFRWRGREISRIEGLSDAVFAFAVTLLVVSLEAPKRFEDPQRLMYGFVSFGICFILALYLIFALLYQHAYRLRAELDLNSMEIHETRGVVHENLVMISIGLIVAIAA